MTLEGNAGGLTTCAAPKAKAQKMGLGEFLTDTCRCFRNGGEVGLKLTWDSVGIMGR